MLSRSLVTFKLLIYILIKQHIICNLEIDTDLYCNKKRLHQQDTKQFNTKQNFCMEADIQYDICSLENFIDVSNLKIKFSELMKSYNCN